MSKWKEMEQSLQYINFARPNSNFACGTPRECEKRWLVMLKLVSILEFHSSYRIKAVPRQAKPEYRPTLSIHDDKCL